MIKENSLKETEKYFSKIHDSHIKKGMLYNVTFELTRKCNFSCIHCYNSFDKEKADLSLEKLKTIVDKIVEKECLYIVLTGGEPLLYKHFKEFWIYAYSKGLLITLFTNASLIDDSIISLFKKYPPYDIEVSLYGFSEKTYSRITGLKNQFDIVKGNIIRLNNEKINFSVKSVAFKYNIKEIKNIYNFTKKINVKFKYDLNISPGINGKKTSHLFASSKDIVNLFNEIEESPKARTTFIKNLNISRKILTPSHKIYTCGAGKATIYIDIKGKIHPCTICRTPEINNSGKTFDEIINNELPKLLTKETKNRNIVACNSCKDSYFCDFCQAIEENRDIHETEKLSWKANICRIARLYKEKFEIHDNPENPKETKEFLVKAGYFELEYNNKFSGEKNG
jgi:MoaA/NifB/PqqE/SkfB family radical SAM enzyme